MYRLHPIEALMSANLVALAASTAVLVWLHPLLATGPAAVTAAAVTAVAYDKKDATAYVIFTIKLVVNLLFLGLGVWGLSWY